MRIQGQSLNGTYTHIQSVPISIWTIVHRLGFNPSVSTVDSTGREVQGAVQYINPDSLTVTFSVEFSGKAFMS